ncbi:MAG: TIGR00375 family protein [Candidatus Hadarchaeota archaeon]
MSELSSFDADLHIHSRYSGATSARMNLETIAQQAKLKGLAIVGTGDVFHPKWMDEIKSELEEVSSGTFSHRRYGTIFLLTVEVEDKNRVHHLILLPSLDAAAGVREKIAKHSPDINSDGRATVGLAAPEIVDIAKAHGCLVGPSHAFTPWTSMYKEFDSVGDCYGESVEGVKFLELGLSADTDMADRIAELADITFISCSDAHSPWPDKLGREFNRMELAEPTYPEVIKALKREDGRRVSLNVGFDPRLGKYHLTACYRCFKQFELEQALKLNWRCNACGGGLKKGVSDRINELADYPEPNHPSHRPKYLRIAPLSEVVALALDVQDPHSPEIQQVWQKLVTRFKNEISVLIDVPVEILTEAAGPRVAAVVKAFRGGNLRVVAGGGGKYGRLELPDELARVPPPASQRKITEFGP